MLNDDKIGISYDSRKGQPMCIVQRSRKVQGLGIQFAHFYIFAHPG